MPSDEEDLQVQTLPLNPRNAEILKTSGAWIIMKALEDIPKLWKQIEGEFSKVSYIPTKALKTKLLSVEGGINKSTVFRLEIHVGAIIKLLKEMKEFNKFRDWFFNQGNKLLLSKGVKVIGISTPDYTIVRASTKDKPGVNRRTTGDKILLRLEALPESLKEILSYLPESRENRMNRIKSIYEPNRRSRETELKKKYMRRRGMHKKVQLTIITKDQAKSPKEAIKVAKERLNPDNLFPLSDFDYIGFDEDDGLHVVSYSADEF